MWQGNRAWVNACRNKNWDLNPYRGQIRDFPRGQETFRFNVFGKDSCRDGPSLKRGQNIEPPGEVFCVSGALIAFRCPLGYSLVSISLLFICLGKRAV